jgi:hypothetical protein
MVRSSGRGAERSAANRKCIGSRLRLSRGTNGMISALTTTPPTLRSRPGLSGKAISGKPSCWPLHDRSLLLRGANRPRERGRRLTGSDGDPRWRVWRQYADWEDECALECGSPSDSKSPRPVFRRGLDSCDGEHMQVICPTWQVFSWQSLLGRFFGKFFLRPRRQHGGYMRGCAVACDSMVIPAWGASDVFRGRSAGRIGRSVLCRRQ